MTHCFSRNFHGSTRKTREQKVKEVRSGVPKLDLNIVKSLASVKRKHFRSSREFRLNCHRIQINFCG